MSNFDLVLRIFLQLTVILAVCRIIGWIGTRFFGQTQVVSEMIAGVLLGPSLFGLLAPEIQQWLFPIKATVGGVTITHPSMSILYVLAQLRLVLYMFIVGLEFNPDHIKGRARSAGAAVDGRSAAGFRAEAEAVSCEGEKRPRACGHHDPHVSQFEGRVGPGDVGNVSGGGAVPGRLTLADGERRRRDRHDHGQPDDRLRDAQPPQW